MNIKKIVVDKLPTSCASCEFRVNTYYCCSLRMVNHDRYDISNTVSVYASNFKRHPDCPLEVDND